MMGEEIALSREIDLKKSKHLNQRFVCHITDEWLSDYLMSLQPSSACRRVPFLSDYGSPEHVNIQKCVDKRKLFDIASWDFQKT